MDDFVICGGSITFFILLFGLIIAMRYMSYRETLALAEKGLVKPDRRNGKGPLVWGVLITSVGAALCLGLLPLGFWIPGPGRFGALGLLGPWLLIGLIPMFFGIGLILVYVMTRETPPKADARVPAGAPLPVVVPEVRREVPAPPPPPAPVDVTRVEKPPSDDAY